MSDAQWTAIAGIVIAVCGLLGVLVESLRRDVKATKDDVQATKQDVRATKDDVAAARSSADAAAANSLPVSNGFTADVRRALKELSDGQEQQHASLARLQAGQDSQSQQLVDLQHRTGRVEAALSTHLNAHASADVQRPRSPIG